MSLTQILYLERQLYFKNKKEYIRNFLYNSNDYKIWQFLKFLRKAEYYKERARKEKAFWVPFLYFRRKKNATGRKLGFDIPEGCFDTGLRIYHISSVVVNPAAQIGKNCIIVGDVCIGNVKGQKTAPKIENDCMLGWGSCILGDITISDHCSIGAGAVVTKSVLQQGAVMVGIPAKDIGSNESCR